MDKIKADCIESKRMFGKQLTSMISPIYENWGICDGHSLYQAAMAAAEVAFLKIEDYHFPALRNEERLESAHRRIRDAFAECPADGYDAAIDEVSGNMAILHAGFEAEHAKRKMEEAYERGNAEEARRLALELLGDEELLRETELLAEDYLDMLEPEEAFARAVAENYVAIAEEFEN